MPSHLIFHFIGQLAFAYGGRRATLKDIIFLMKD